MPSPALPLSGSVAGSAATQVVIIDDDTALLNALKFGLELEGFSVSTHFSPAEIRLQDLPRVNGCLVIDYRLPGLNGLQLLARLRADGVDLPAVLITSHPTAAMAANAARLGATVVEKPLLNDRLTVEIGAAVARAADA